MMWLDLAVASRRDAERAFFDFDDVDAVDDIPRLQLRDCSEFELAHLGMLLCEGFDPELVLDGDADDEIVSACDRRLVAALAGLDDAALAALATRWQQASGIDDARAMLEDLRDFAVLASQPGMALLYAQGTDTPPGD